MSFNEHGNGLLDMRGFNKDADPLWDLVVLPVAAFSLLTGKPKRVGRLGGVLGLLLCGSRAVALYGQPRSAR